MELEHKKHNKKFFNSLTGIFAVAAWAVFLFHFNPFSKGSLLGGFVEHLYIGVDIFFVLSGFLIYYRYHDSFKLTKAWMGKYISNRVARIYPMFFILTTITILFHYLNSLFSSSFTFVEITKNTLFHYFMNISFLKAFFYDLRFSGIPQAWTLTVEECFYLSAPLIFLFQKRIKIWVQPFIWLVIGLVIVYMFEGNAPYGFMKDNQFMLIFTFFGRAFEFYIGIFLAQNIIRKRKIRNKVFNTFIGLTGIIVLLLVVSIFHSAVFPPYGRIILTQFILPIFIYFLFLGLINENTILKKILEFKQIVLLGKSSYIFYLIHMGLFHQLINDYITNSILISFILLNIISIVLYKFLETPMNSLVRNKYESLRIRSLTIPN